MTSTHHSTTVTIVIFLALITVQVLIRISSDIPVALYGDEQRFVEKALVLKNTGSFPGPSDQHGAVIRGDAWGWSDFKAPGMSLYRAPLLIGIQVSNVAALTDAQLRTIRYRLRWVQMIMAVCSTDLIFASTGILDAMRGLGDTICQ